MKKITLNLITLLIAVYAHSQISLEQTYTVTKHIQFLKIDDGTTKYYIFNDYEMKIYNSDHSIYQTILIEDLGLTSYPENPILACVSEKVFDIDTGIEFLFCTGDNSGDKTFIIDDDGSIIFEKENQTPPLTGDDNDTFQNPWWIQNTDNGIKMVLTSNPYLDYGSVQNYMYSLPGTATLKTAEIIKENFNSKAFPNPSKNYLNISYKLPNELNLGKIIIYSLSGQKIKEYNVDNHVSSLKISNEDLSSGTYLYRIVAGGYKSESHKIVISK